MVIVVHLSAILFGMHLYCQSWNGNLANAWHGFPKFLHGPLQGPNRFVAHLPQLDKTSRPSIINDYRMPSSFVRTLPFRLHRLLVWL